MTLQQFLIQSQGLKPFVGSSLNLGFSIANENQDLGYFLQMVSDLGTESKIAEGSSANLQAAFDAGMGQGNVPEIFDYFKTLEK
jgi:3-hydroxyisobutyrate dehydrogenase